MVVAFYLFNVPILEMPDDPLDLLVAPLQLQFEHENLLLPAKGRLVALLKNLAGLETLLIDF